MRTRTRSSYSLPMRWRVDADSTKLGRSHRVGKKQQGKDKAIIAKFIRHNVKVVYIKDKKNLLDIKHRKNVYINEDLTQKRSGWLLRARTLRRKDKIISCVTADGVLFTKRKVGNYEQTTRIASDDESHIHMVNQEALEAPGIESAQDERIVHVRLVNRRGPRRVNLPIDNPSFISK